MVVLFLAHNGQHKRVTTCHLTKASQGHNKLTCLFNARDQHNAGRTQIRRKDFLSGRQWSRRANPPLLSKATFSSNESHSSLFRFVAHSTITSEMDFFAFLDSVLFVQDPTTSFSSASTEVTTASPSLLSTQSDIPLDEDRQGSGYVSGFCVIS